MKARIRNIFYKNCSNILYQKEQWSYAIVFRQHTKAGLPMYTIKQIKQLEQLAIEKWNVSAQELMQRAGAEALDLLKNKYPAAKKIAVFCGSGNNAGDGYVMAAKAMAAGITPVCFYLTDPLTLKQPALQAYEQAVQNGVVIQAFSDDLPLEDYDVLVDALLGTGFKGDLQKNFYQAITLLNNTNKPVIALDVPSGLNADTGQVTEIAVEAQYTLTFIGVKQGLCTADAPDYCGNVWITDLDLPKELFEATIPTSEIMNFNAIKHNYLLPRKYNSHKGNYGHVAVIGGDIGMGGAVQMASEAAARAGAGLTSVYTRPEHISGIIAGRPEVMAHPLNDPSLLSTTLATALDRASVLAIGPGLGRHAWGEHCFNAVMALNKPTVIDADALWFLAQQPRHLPQAILTPHPKEAAMLLNISTAEVQQDRFAAIRKLQQQYGGVIVLKGAGTLVFNGEDPVYVCPFGNPGMASGGMGDVLTGLIAGLLAQNIPALPAAGLAVCLHSRAADRCAHDEGQRGMLALDLLRYVRKLMN